MTVTTTNLLMGPASLYTGLVGAAEPPSNATALGVPWTDAGGTSGGVNLNLVQTYTPLGPIDQLATEAGAQRTAFEIEVATNLAEATLANLRVALNQAVSAATFQEIDGLVSGAAPNYQAVCLQGMKPGGGPRRVFVRRTLSVDNIGVPFQKDGLTLFPVKFRGYFVSASVNPFRIDDTP